MHNNDQTPDNHDDNAAHTDDVTDTQSAQGHPLDPSPGEDATANEALTEETLIEESLHHALSDLEQILERHEGPGQVPGQDADDDTGERATDAGLYDDGEEQQYVIPLLDEVVIAGPDGYTPQAEAGGVKQSFPDDDDDEPALRKRLAERLASEVEIITQDRIEAALETAREEIRVQVRNHLDIILPEIVEELNQLRRRPNGNPQQ